MKVCGIDPGRRILSVSYVEDMEERYYREYENTWAGYKELEEDLRERGIKLVCIEGHGDSSRQAAVYLEGKGFEIYEINPSKLKRLKESMTENKTDHIDAFTCAMFPFIRKDMNALSLDPEVQGLKRLTRLYEKISKQIVSFKNQLHAELHQSFGSKYKKVFTSINRTSLGFFMRFSTPEDVVGADVEEIYEALKGGGSCMYKGGYGVRKAERIKEVLTEGYDEGLKELTDIEGVVIRSICKVLLRLMEEKDRIKREIEGYVNRLYPGYKEYFRGIKGLTPLRFGQVMGEIQDIRRFPDDGHLASYSGQAPVKEQSSSKSRMKNKRKYYNRHLAHVIHQIACSNVKKGSRYYEEYQEGKRRYRRRLRALKNIKRKIVRLIYHGLVNYTKSLSEQEQNQEVNYAFSES